MVLSDRSIREALESGKIIVNPLGENAINFLPNIMQSFCQFVAGLFDIYVFFENIYIWLNEVLNNTNNVALEGFFFDLISIVDLILSLLEDLGFTSRLELSFDQSFSLKTLSLCKSLTAYESNSNYHSDIFLTRTSFMS